MTRHGVEPRVCLDCARDDLAREGETLERCPDCGGPVR
jgi:DNA-directed RNA polymerase subunit RPC12/RpoP